MLHLLLKNMIIGLLTGLSTSYIILTFFVFVSEDKMITGEELILQVLVAAIMGIAIGLSMLIFKVNKLPFTIQLLVHYLSVLIYVYIAGLIAGWYSFSDWTSMLNLFLIASFIYVIVWLMVRVILKKEIDEINQLIQNRKKG